MNIIIYRTGPYNISFTTICPFCNNVSTADDPDLQIEDYVDPYAMLWCRNCGIDCVLNVKIIHYVDCAQLNETTLARYKCDRPNNIKAPQTDYYRVPLLKTVRYIDNDLADYYATTPIEEEKVLAFIANGYQGELTIHKREGEIDDDLDRLDFNVSLSLNKYDVCMEHGGIYAYLLLENGVKMCYWGD